MNENVLYFFLADSGTCLSCGLVEIDRVLIPITRLARANSKSALVILTDGKSVGCLTLTVRGSALVVRI